MSEQRMRVDGNKFVTAEEIESLLNDAGVGYSSARWSFVGGSLVQGWGNADSDLDIYVVVDDLSASLEFEDVHETRLARSSVPVISKQVGGRRSDLEIWTQSQVEEVFGKLATASSSSALEGFSYFELDFLEKLDHGGAILNLQSVADHQDRLLRSRWREAHVEQSLLLMDIYVEDAIGQMDAGDVESAVLSSKLAFGNAVDAVARRGGCGGHNPKWRARRLQLLDAHPLRYEEYWSLETMQSFDPVRPQGWIDEVITVCRRVSASVPVAS